MPIFELRVLKAYNLGFFVSQVLGIGRGYYCDVTMIQNTIVESIFAADEKNALNSCLNKLDASYKMSPNYTRENRELILIVDFKRLDSLYQEIAKGDGSIVGLDHFRKCIFN